MLIKFLARTASLFLIFYIFWCTSARAQDIISLIKEKRVSTYFQEIRKNEAELTAFISQMPKGGDLHNHYSGSIYAETYVNWLINADYCVNIYTLDIGKPDAQSTDTTHSFFRFSSLLSSKDASYLENLRNRLIRRWSTKEYEQVHSDAREEHFFATFGNFSAASGLNFSEGLKELKERAKKENTSYLEIMFSNIRCNFPDSQQHAISKKDTIKYYNELLKTLGKKRDTVSLKPVLQYLYSAILNYFPVNDKARSVNQFVDSLHQHFIGDADTAFTMRYLAFITRTGDPLNTFVNLVTAFETVNQCTSGNLSGLNIVAPEDDPVSMRDYWLHMQFFAFCKKMYGNVTYSMHAGELTEGVVQPEELSWHINSAVIIAGANRIGHGVDIAYEKDNYSLLRYMSTNKIPVEINLLSNEFILGVKDDRHPVLLYKHFNVPIIISTDDPGVSRTSLTEQYVLLAKRYEEITYPDIKKYVYNSINFSFIKDQHLKEKLIQDIDRRFQKFESYILALKP